MKKKLLIVPVFISVMISSFLINPTKLSAMELTETIESVKLTETENPYTLYDTTLVNCNDLFNLLDENDYNYEKISTSVAEQNLQTVLSTAIKVKSKYESSGVPTVSDCLMIYEDKSEKSEELGKLLKGSKFEIIKDFDDGWTKVQSNNIIGFVKTEYIATSFDMEQYIAENKEDFNEVARVNVKQLNVRKSCDTDKNNVIESIEYDDKLVVIEEKEDWVKVKCDDSVGYVKKEYVDVQIDFKKAIDLEEERKSKFKDEVVEYAKSFIGQIPYIWGGADLSTGVDCSGFVQQVYNKFGYNISRTSREQAFDGKTVNIEDVKKGDLFFFINPKTGLIGHVAMYIGNNQLVHASSPETGIRISNVGYRDYCKIVRIIE